MRWFGDGRSEEERERYAKHAKWHQTEETTNVEIADQCFAASFRPFQGQHQNQTCVDKKYDDAHLSEVPRNQQFGSGVYRL